MALVTLDSISFEIGDQKILNETSLAIENNERICLIGRNGAGKSTLLKLIMGDLEADSGEIQKQGNIRISQLEQCLPETLDKSVWQYVLEGLKDLQLNLDLYHKLSEQKLDKAGLRELENLQHDIEICDNNHTVVKITWFKINICQIHFVLVQETCHSKDTRQTDWILKELLI